MKSVSISIIEDGFLFLQAAGESAQSVYQHLFIFRVDSLANMFISHKIVWLLYRGITATLVFTPFNPFCDVIPDKLLP